MTEPSWLTADDIIEINQTAVLSNGDPYFLRDLNLLESAVNRPIDKFHYGTGKDLIVLGCELVFGIAKNHAFEDGNKRTAYTALLLFLNRNGYEFTPSDIEEVAKIIEDLAAGVDDAFDRLDDLVAENLSTIPDAPLVINGEPCPNPVEPD